MMSSHGKTIELFLVNGKEDELVIAEIYNWSGKIIKIPQTDIKNCDREEINGIGVYFLIGQEEGMDTVYIGESENIKQRLLQHLNAYDQREENYFWNTALIVLGKDLNKGLIKYLEHRLVEIARKCKRYKVLTKNTSKNTVIKESHKANMDEFIEFIKILINTLGYNILTSPKPKPSDKKEYFYCRNVNKNADATGFNSTGGFTVIKGSKIVQDKDLVDSFEELCPTYFKLRKVLIQEGIIQENEFSQNYEFKSPSAASSVVLGRSSNGQTDWKKADNITLKSSKNTL